MAGIVASVTKIGEVIAKWLDPERIEKAKLHGIIKVQGQAIEAAENLLQLRSYQGIYKNMKPERIEKYRIHWEKRWNAFKDGTA